MKFRMRYVAGGALLLGIAAGVWLGGMFKGFGPGGNGNGGFGGPGADTQVSLAGNDTADIGVAAVTQPVVHSPTMLRVVIKDRSYFLRDGAADTPVELTELVAAVKRQAPDEDGIRVRVFRTNNARVTAVLDLQQALEAAQIPAAAIYVSPDAVE